MARRRGRSRQGRSSRRCQWSAISAGAHLHIAARRRGDRIGRDRPESCDSDARNLAPRRMSLQGHGLPSRLRWEHDRCTPVSRRLAALQHISESGQNLTHAPQQMSGLRGGRSPRTFSTVSVVGRWPSVSRSSDEAALAEHVIRNSGRRVISGPATSDPNRQADGSCCHSLGRVVPQ